MALDVSDLLLESKDIFLQDTDKFRAYNLLYRPECFPENVGIGLNLAEIVLSGLDSNQMERLVLNYLSDFKVNVADVKITNQKAKYK